MRILGIDPGFATLGFGIIEQERNQIQLIDFGCLQTTPQSSYPQRLNFIYQQLSNILSKYSPDIIAVEKLFFSKNVKTAIQIGEVRGVVILIAVQNGFEIKEYTPLQIKLSVVGYGRATKEQIQKMVKVLLHLPQIPQPDDAADALAVAICYAHSHKLDTLLKSL